MRPKESLTWLAYRVEPLRRLMDRPYPYWLTPGELSYLVHAIDATREAGTSILEIGVGRGRTSAFLLEHLRRTGDPRSLVCIDTFSGFTNDSVEFEVTRRAKRRRDLDVFRYGNRAIFERSLRSQGYEQVRVIEADASTLDFGTFAPIGVVLLDIDLYQPTIACLDRIEPHLAPEAFVLVDDCRPGLAWDGSLQAYHEFMAARGVGPRIVGGKGGVFERRAAG